MRQAMHDVASTHVAADEERAYYETSRRIYASWIASIYDLVVSPLRPLRDAVTRLAQAHADMRVIDVATGTGAQARAFARAGAEVTGIDLSPRMLAIARRKMHGERIEYVEGDATALPAADASFDIASISFALHEMPPTIRARSIAELVRVTARGGRIVIVDFARPRNRTWRFIAEHVIALFERHYYREFLRADLDAGLRRAGAAITDQRRATLDCVRILVARR